MNSVGSRFSFEYTPASIRVSFGTGNISTIDAELERLAIENAAVFCSPTREAQVNRIRGNSTRRIAKLFTVTSKTSAGDFEKICRDLRNNFNGLIAFGGGETIRIGKAFAANTRLPLIATPTTYSGAEFAPNWYVGIGPEAKRGAGEAALPRTIIYDCKLTRGLPIAVAAASGMNAMAHAVESLYGPDRIPLIEAAAEEAVRKLNIALPRIAANPSDMGARSDAMLGAWLAAAYRARTSLEHALAQFLRHMFDLNHAETHAVVLPYVLAFNRDHIPDARIRLQRALGADEPAGALYQLNRRLGLKTGLREIGMTEAQVAIAIDGLSKQDLSNPRPVTAADLENIVKLAFTGAAPNAL